MTDSEGYIEVSRSHSRLQGVKICELPIQPSKRPQSVLRKNRFAHLEDHSRGAASVPSEADSALASGHAASGITTARALGHSKTRTSGHCARWRPGGRTEEEMTNQELDRLIEEFSRGDEAGTCCGEVGAH